MISIWIRLLGIFFFSAVFVTSSFAWTIKMSFDDGPVGAFANQDQGYNGFNGAGRATVFTDEISADGTQSCKMSWPKGHNGWAVCYGRITFSDNPGARSLKEGDELWVRAYYYFKSPWDWYVPGGPHNKILRVHTKHADGGNGGYISFLSNSRGQIIGDSEVGPRPKNYRTNYHYALDRWQCLEMYIKFSTKEPILRMWVDGKLIIEDTNKNTLKYPSTIADGSFIATAWAGGAPQDQVQYVDAFVFTTDKPSKRDADGNPMIGPIDIITGGNKSVNSGGSGCYISSLNLNP